MVMFSRWASRIKFHLSVSASKVGNPAKGNWKFLNSSSCFNTAAIEISVIGKITRIPRREHSALTVERNDCKPAVGEGYVKFSLQYFEEPARVLFVSSATTTGMPLLPRERVAAKALRALPSRMRIFSILCRRSPRAHTGSGPGVLLPVKGSDAVFSSVMAWKRLFIGRDSRDCLESFS